ncbi:hypothetical protein [Cyanobacterium sp. uoEpiScrs1]|uniref:hypothetical protein n=1 Tax=Cyanobacterium sp. uoEpiScrs1 TaxID=2976343 RepID=UPI0022698126|nr:hypothetical protein [Cyanobacterium sp. uoEpiScrs1]
MNRRSQSILYGKSIFNFKNPFKFICSNVDLLHHKYPSKDAASQLFSELTFVKKMS